jgi:RNA polymerase sigma-70 factor (ECF subfamily)
VDVLAARDTAGAGDDILLRLAARGDVAAFDALIAGRIDRCYRIAWSILTNEADAADASQEAFVTAWRELPRLRNPAAFDGWLNRIVANTSLMAHRRRKRRREVQVLPTSGAGDGTNPEPAYATTATGEIDAVAETDAISRAFAQLRPEERTILVLHHVDDRPVGEIARTLGVPEGTAKSRLHTARQALQRAMEAEA